MVRLMAAVRALTPPAIAVSTQVPPALANCSANTFTAADSPPEVHQWITSAFISSALAPGVAATTTQASASDVVQSLAVMASSLASICNRLHFCLHCAQARPESMPYVGPERCQRRAG